MAMYKKLTELTDEEVNVKSKILTRLEGWIKDSNEVWHDGFSKRVKLSPENCKIFEKPQYHSGYGLMVGDKDMGDITNFSGDVDKAEWNYKMTAIQTLCFEPPFWNDFEKSLMESSHLWSFQFFGEDHSLFEISVGDCTVVVMNISKDETVYWKKTSRESYEEACKIVSNLMRGSNE